MTTFEIIQSVLVAGTATTLATQFLKQSYIPLPATKHPRLTAAAVSLVASGVVLAQAGIEVASVGDWLSALAVFAGVLLIAANTYNAIIKRD